LAGNENGANDWDSKGSDWERCFQALHGDGYQPFATVAFDGGELLTITINSGGWVDAFRVGDGLVLVEPAYSELEDDGSAYSGLRRDAGFLDYVTSPFGGAATEAGFVAVKSGAVAFLPAPSSGEEIPAALLELSPDGAARFPLEASAAYALVVRLPAGRYRVRIEDPVERSWNAVQTPPPPAAAVV
jgi:hypothetical protein